MTRNRKPARMARWDGGITNKCSFWNDQFSIQWMIHRTRQKESKNENKQREMNRLTRSSLPDWVIWE